MPAELTEVLVPCPYCRKVHRISVAEVENNREVKMPCGATLGSVGLMRHVERAREKAKGYNGPIYKLE